MHLCHVMHGYGVEDHPHPRDPSCVITIELKKSDYAPSYSRCPLMNLLGKMLYSLGVILWQLVMRFMAVPQCWYWPLLLEASTVSCWIR